MCHPLILLTYFNFNRNFLEKHNTELKVESVHLGFEAMLIRGRLQF